MTDGASGSGKVMRGRYEITGRLHRSAMNDVLVGIDLHGDDLNGGDGVVVKTALPDPNGRRQDHSDRLVLEAHILRLLRHPRVIRPLEAWDDSSGCGLVTEHLRGRDLERYLRSDIVIPMPIAIRIAVEALEGLGAVHAAGYLHRDIKPANLMLTPDGVKLIDFGLAGDLRSGTARLTPPGFAAGTPAYMAPEQLVDGTRLDGRVDLYAIGLVLHQMLTGIDPLGEGVDERDVMAVLRRKLREDPAPFRIAAPGLRLPQRLEEAVFRSLARDPDRRFSTAEEMREALIAAAP